MHLNTVIPHTRCYVRRTFLTAGQAPPDQLIECELIGAQSNIGRPIQFHVLLRDGAVFYNLPIHAFAHHLNPREVKYSDAPTRQQLWDNPTATMVCTVWPRLTGLRCTVRTLDGEIEGEYVFSLDWYHADVSNVTSHPIEIPNERKCAQVIAGDDGLYYAAANNFVVWMDPSWVIESPANGADGSDVPALSKRAKAEHHKAINTTKCRDFNNYRDLDAFPEFTFENPPQPMDGFEWKIRSDSTQTDQYFIARYTGNLDDTFETTYFKVCQIPF